MDDDFLSRNFTLFLSLFSVTCSGSNVGTGVYVNLHSYLEGHNLKSKSQKQVLKKSVFTGKRCRYFLYVCFSNATPQPVFFCSDLQREEKCELEYGEKIYHNYTVMYYI